MKKPIRRDLIIFFFSILLLLSFTTAVSGETITLGDCARATVQAAIDTALDNATITCPAGSWNWGTTPVVINGKNLTLSGAPNNGTVITVNWAGSAPVDIVTTVGTYTRVTEFKFIMATDAGSGMGNIVNVSGPGTRFRIDHVTFDPIKRRGIVVTQAKGVIDHNVFMGTTLGSGSPQGVSIIGNRATGGGDTRTGSIEWQYPPEFGTANNVFVEDNTFIWTAEADSFYDAYGGARFVIRYNTIYQIAGGHHGNDSGEYRSPHSYEIYNNTLYRTGTNHWTSFNNRGGTGVYFNNAVNGLFNGSLVLQNYRSLAPYGTAGMCDGTNPRDGNLDATGWPCQDQIGRTTDVNGDGIQDSMPLHQWNNTLNGQPWVPVVQTGVESHIQVNRDYFNRAPQPGDPIYPYVPYTYPHPLVTGTTPLPDTQAPTIPTNLSATAVSSSQINLTWTASTDNVGVTGYRIYRSGTQIATVTSGTLYSNTGLSPSTTYSYTVAAYDTAGNVSAQSSLASATTQASTALTYYVDNSGSPACSDTAGQNGSESNPWCTITYAVGRITGGDILYVKAGTYNENLFVDRPAGTSGKPTIIQAFPGNMVTLRGNGVDTGRVKITNTSYITFDGFIITNYNQGLWVVNSNNIVVQNVTVHNVGQEGIHAGDNSSYVTIQNSTVHDTRKWQYNGEGIYLGTGSGGPLDNSHHFTIRNNTVYNTTDEGIELKPGTHDFIVEGNTLYNVGTGLGSSVGHGIEFERQILGAQSYNADPNHIIRNNTIRSSGTAIRIGSGSTVYNNLIHNITSGHYGIRVENPDGDSYPRKIYHNTIDTPSVNAVSVSGGTADVRNNIGPSTTNNIVTSDSYYVSKAGANYHLVSGSIPVNAGLDLITIVPIDIEGISRSANFPPDLGAYEFVSGADTTPPAAPIGLAVQ